MKRILKITSVLSICALLFTSCHKDPVETIPPVANAGDMQTIQLPAPGVTLTGSGTSSNGIITGYLWSLISGPNIPDIASPSSPSTNISNLVSGAYLFQFAVIDDAGLTGIDTVSVIVNSATGQTVTLQPSNNPNEGHVDSYNVLGGGGDTELEIAAWTIFGTPTNWRSYVKFDQSAIPSGATIASAILYLYAMPTPHSANVTNAMNGSANTMYIERITGNWTAAGLTYASLPATTNVNRVSVAQTASAFENAVINVTSLVQDMHASGNYGFGFRLQNETTYNSRAYASSFYSDANLRPKLVITYQ